MKTLLTLLLLLLLLTNTQALLIPQNSTLPTYHKETPDFRCTTDNGGNDVPKVSDALQAIFKLDNQCNPNNTPYWQMFDQSPASNDPKQKNCKIYSTQGTVVLALCMSPVGFSNVPYVQMAGLPCSDAVAAYERLVDQCQVRGKVRGHMVYSWGSVNIYHPV